MAVAQPLFDRAGKPRGDKPLGIAYTEDGVPVPDWDIVIEEGERRGARIEGAIDLKDYVTDRSPPSWGKRFGLVRKTRVGAFGSLTTDEAKLCLTTEDFGWVLGEESPVPPYVRLCYGELHGEQESIRIFTGLSEIHLLKDLDVREVHYMLQGLGYVCYNVPAYDEDRWWGPGIDCFPQKVSAGLPGGKGPMFYSWYYRLPPWMPGLVKEGEAGDYLNGPIALKIRQSQIHKTMQAQKDGEDHLDELKHKALEQQEDWDTSKDAVAADYDEEKE